MLVSKINFNVYNNRCNQSRQIVNNDSYHSNINFKGTPEKIIQTVSKKI